MTVTRGKTRRPGAGSGRGSSDLRSLLGQETLGQMAGVEDHGSVHTQRVEHPDGDDPVIVDSDQREIRVWAVDVATGRPVMATLYAPANALWRKPPTSDIVTVMRGSNTGGPCARTAFHGDGGNDGDVPAALTDDQYTNPTVLSPPTGDVVIESRDGNATIVTGETKIVVNKDGNVDITTSSGKTVNINGSDYHLPKWDDFLRDLSTTLSTLNTILTTGTTGGPFAQTITLASMFATTPLMTSPASTYESTKGKNG